jgi:hypothetical protein
MTTKVIMTEKAGHKGSVQVALIQDLSNRETRSRRPSEKVTVFATSSIKKVIGSSLAEHRSHGRSLVRPAGRRDERQIFLKGSGDIAV